MIYTKELKWKSIVIDHLQFYNDNMFKNMNTPEDYELIKNIYELK